MKKLPVLFLFCSLGHLYGQFDFANVGQTLGLVDSCGFSKWGAAVSFVDFNGDGWDDLTLGTKAGENPFFYLNDGGTGFTKLPALVDFPFENKMILWVDYDNDGDKDLYLNALGKPNRLFRNEGDLQMVDVTETAGLPIADHLSWGAAFGDYNRDGWLDLYTVNRQIDSAVTNYLYLNNGDGTFTDVTDALGVSDGEQLTFCATFLDIHQNLWPDLYLANDRIYGNTLFQNNGEQGFSDISNFSAAGLEIDAMNVGSGDYDNDGDLDIYVTNTSFGGNVLLRNNGNGIFTNVSEEANVQFFSTCWAGLFLDFDNDRDEDLYVCSMVDLFQEANRLYENLGDGTFDELYPVGLPGDQVPSFSAAFGDFDNNGQLDLIVPNNGEKLPKLWHNQFNNNHNWVKIQLEGVASNRDGIGAWIEVWAAGQKTVRYTHCGDNYMSQNTLTHHIGLGLEPAIDSLVIKWPSGKEDRMVSLAVNDTYFIQEGATQISSTHPLAALQSMGHVYPDPATDEIYLDLELREAATLECILLDQSGRKLLRIRESLAAGVQTLSIPVGQLNPGVYSLRINEATSWQIRRFVKVR